VLALRVLRILPDRFGAEGAEGAGAEPEIRAETS
jgi:hypothetical protein